MAALPRIITVDPSGNIPQQIRAAFDLMDRLVVQIDVPGANEALDELKRGDCHAVIAAWEPGDGMQGWELAAKLRQIDDDVAIMLLGDYDDTDMDDDMLEQSPFVYLKRPFNIPQLIRVLEAAINGEDIFEAVHAGPTLVESVKNMGPVPEINQEKASEYLQNLQTDLNALAILLADREGRAIQELGTLMDLNRDELTHTVLSAVMTTVDLRELIGGNTSALQFFDGDNYDVYLISVGLHHFLCIVFEGSRGSRELGGVSRYGRRTAEDLIGLLGASAWFIQPTEIKEEPEVLRKSRPRPTKAEPEEEEKPQLERAKLSTSEVQAINEAQEAAAKLEAIADDAFDPDALFNLDLDESEADTLFSLEALEDVETEENRKGLMGQDQAEELGLLDV